MVTPAAAGVASAVVGVVAQTTTSAANGADGVSVSLPNLIDAAVVVVVAYVLARTGSYALTAVADRAVKHRFRVTSVIPILKFCIYGVAAYLVLTSLFDLTTTQLVAFSGLLGAAIGLGLKDFLADIVGGLVVVVEQPYQVGDKVSLGDHYGEVTNIGLRSTTLVTPNDTAVVVPNFTAVNESVANNNTSDAEMLVITEFHIAPESDTGRAVEIVEEALLSSRYVYVDDDHPCTVLVSDERYYQTLTGRAYVNDLRNERLFQTDVTKRVLEAFDDAGIESPAVPTGGVDGR